MFKWLLVLIIIFFSVWFAKKDYIPYSFRNSTPGKTLNSALFNAEYKLHGQSAKSKRHDAEIVQIDEVRLNSVLTSLTGSNKQAVIFLYDTKCFFCRYVLPDINDLAREYSKNTIFLVVAHESDRGRLNFLLSQMDKLYFRPIMTAPSNIKTAAASFNRANIGFSEVPVTIFKNPASKNFENITTDFYTEDYLEDRLQK